MFPFARFLAPLSGNKVVRPVYQSGGQTVYGKRPAPRARVCVCVWSEEFLIVFSVVLGFR